MWEARLAYLELLKVTEWTPGGGLDCSDTGLAMVEFTYGLDTIAVPDTDVVYEAHSRIASILTGSKSSIPTAASAWLLGVIAANNLMIAANNLMDADFNMAVLALEYWTSILMPENIAVRQQCVSTTHAELSELNATLSRDESRLSTLRFTSSLCRARYTQYVDTFAPTKDWDMVGFTAVDMDAAEADFDAADLAVQIGNTSVTETRSIIRCVGSVLDIISTVPCGGECVRMIPMEILRMIFDILYADNRDHTFVAGVCRQFNNAAVEYGFVTTRQLGWARGLGASSKQTVWQRGPGVAGLIPRLYSAAFGPAGPIILNSDRGTVYKYVFDPAGGLGILNGVGQIGIKKILTDAKIDTTDFRVVKVVYMAVNNTVAVVLSEFVVVIDYDTSQLLGVSRIADENPRIRAAVTRVDIPTTLVLQATTGVFYSYDTSVMGATFVPIVAPGATEYDIKCNSIVELMKADYGLTAFIGTDVAVSTVLREVGFLAIKLYNANDGKALGEIQCPVTDADGFRGVSYYRGVLYVMKTRSIVTYRYQPAVTDQ